MERLAIYLLILITYQAQARPVPVYMKPNTPAATGHFSHMKLKKRAQTYEDFEWLWLRDSFGHEGWALKSSVMLPLDFSRRAVLSREKPIYPKPKTLGQAFFETQNRQVVTMKSRYEDWYQVLFKRGKDTEMGWVKSKDLRPYSKDPGFFYSTKEDFLRTSPQNKSKLIKKINAGIALTPLKISGQWALVKSGKHQGYFPIRKLKSRIEIAMKVRTPKGYYKPHKSLIQQKVLEIFANPLWVGTGAYTIDLKAKPDMGSNTVTTIAPWQSLTLQGYSIKRWGQSPVKKWGNLWWPDRTTESNIEFIESFKPRGILLSKKEVFQIEKSPVVKDLSFASTLRGVFRSFDGKDWHPIPDFKNGYPIQVTSNGTLFVGDKVSFDHGESFNEYIRWDKVLTAIPIERKLGHSPIQILNVEPNKKNSQQVTLSLKLGSKRAVQIFTPNLGKDWRML